MLRHAHTQDVLVAHLPELLRQAAVGGLNRTAQVPNDRLTLGVHAGQGLAVPVDCGAVQVEPHRTGTRDVGAHRPSGKRLLQAGHHAPQDFENFVTRYRHGGSFHLTQITICDVARSIKRPGHLPLVFV